MPRSKGRKNRKGRRTAPRPAVTATKQHEKDPSPKWFVVAMFGLMGLGVVLVLLRYVIFTGSNLVLVAGLAAIAAGFLMTTSYR